MFCCRWSPAGFVVRTCTSWKGICRRFDRSSFPVIRSWGKWSKARPRSYRWELVPAFPGWAVWMAIAGTAITAWKICAIGLFSRDTPWMEVMPSMSLARADFTFPLPAGLDDVHVAPLLCAGIIGFRSLRVAGVEQGERVGLFGFGSSASLAIAILQSWKCEVYVVTRGESHRKRAVTLGATLGRKGR